MCIYIYVCTCVYIYIYCIYIYTYSIILLSELRTHIRKCMASSFSKIQSRPKSTLSSLNHLACLIALIKPHNLLEFMNKISFRKCFEKLQFLYIYILRFYKLSMYIIFIQSVIYVSYVFAFVLTVLL